MTSPSRTRLAPAAAATVLALLACQPFGNPPGQLVARTATPTSTPTPGSSASTLTPEGFATPEPEATPENATPTVAQGSVTPAFPDLNGVWDDNGHLIVIVQSGVQLSAAYIEERICSHDDGTGAQSAYRHDFHATLAFEDGAWTLTSEDMSSCAYGYPDTSSNGVRLTQMRAVLSEDFNTIVGDWYADLLGEWRDDSLQIVRQIGEPTPEGFTLPTSAP